MNIRVFLVGLAALVVTVPAMAENQSRKAALENYIAEQNARMEAARASAAAVRECVLQEASDLSSAPASPTEIAQASLYRCISKLDDYAGKAFGEAYFSAPTNNENEKLEYGKNESRYLRTEFENGLTRMAIDTVIRARSVGK